MKMQSSTRGLRELCRLLGYSRQAYYQHQLKSGKRALQEDLVVARVLALRSIQPRVGVRKLHTMMEPFMAAHGIEMGRDVLYDLLRANGLLIKIRHSFKPRTTDSGHWMKRYPDLIQDRVLSRPDELWVSDITYIRLKSSRFAYLSLVTDAYSRKIVGYCMNRDLSVRGPVSALQMALKGRGGNGQLIHHSDRGSQYCSEDYTDMLTSSGIQISMTQSGNPKDNAIAERVNGILKTEFLDEAYSDVMSAHDSVVKAIETYNTIRLHSSVDMQTPEQAHQQTGSIRRRWKSWHERSCRKTAL